MKKFYVTITETLQKRVEVEAIDDENAEDIIAEIYGKKEISLDSNNLIGTQFDVSTVEKDNLSILVEYIDKLIDRVL